MEIAKIELAHGARRLKAQSGRGWTEDIPIMIPMEACIESISPTYFSVRGWR